MSCDVTGFDVWKLLQASKGRMRDKVQLATKFGMIFQDGKVEVRGDPAYVRSSCESSLKRLDVDCIDLYYAHRIDTRVPIEVTVSTPFFSSVYLKRVDISTSFTVYLNVCSACGGVFSC